MTRLDPRNIVCLVLCAGEGTRLRPLTLTRPKQLLPLCNVPVIDYILADVRAAGVEQVGMVVGRNSDALRAHVTDGTRWGLDVEWIVQEQPAGIGDAVLAAETFVGRRPFVVYLGDALYENGIGDFVDRFAQVFPSSLVRLAPVEDPHHYGVAVIENGIITHLDEKPKRPRSNLVVTGLYAFPAEFFGAIRQTQPSARGELEITDALTNFLPSPAGVCPEISSNAWADTGQPHSFLAAGRWLLDRLGKMQNAATVDGSSLVGEVGAGDGTTIRQSQIEGPVLMGRGCRIRSSRIGPYVSIGDGSIVEDSCVRDTIIDAESEVRNLPSGLQASIIGQRSRIVGNGRANAPLSKVVGDDAEVQVD